MDTTRFPHAPSGPLPELAEFLAPFHVHFRRSEGPASLARYCTGLLTEHPNKNCDTIARVVPDTSEQRLQGFLTAMKWDAGDLNRQRVQRMLELPTEGDGVLVFDDTGFPKQGKCSVGVARQYSGTLGKTGNCQVAVNCHYAERTLAWPVATRLYLPKPWADDPARRATAGVPGNVTFRTKPEIALALLDQAKAWGVRWACVTADADYGDNPNFLAGLEERGERYVVAVRADFRAADARGAGAIPRRADALLGALPASAWRAVRWREGSKGWLRGRFAAVRCWRATSDGRRRVGWLVGEREARGQAARRKFYWSNLGPRAALGELVEYAHRRHWVERYHEEAKGLLGWDQYQGRLWTGFHRHAVTVMLAYSFLVWQEARLRSEAPRPGPRRRAFSPSAGSAAGAAAGGPPAGRGLVEAGGRARDGSPGAHRPVPPQALVTHGSQSTQVTKRN
jgi:SRSO17 transposase